MSLTMNDAVATRQRHGLLKAFGYLSIGLSIVSVTWLVFATVAALDIASWVARTETAHDLLGDALRIRPPELALRGHERGGRRADG